MKIRYYGHNGQLSGYGRAADEMVEALAAAGAELEVRPLSPPASWNRACTTSRFFTYDRDLTAPDAIVIHTLPLSFEKALAEITTTPHAVEVPVVGYTTWEALDVPTQVIQAIRCVDQIWVPSKAAERAIVTSWEQDRLDELEVRVVPHAFDESRDYVYTGDRPAAPFTFYYVGGWSARKNPIGLIRAFCGEFDRSENVRLLLQCHGVPREVFAQAMMSTGIPQADHPNVQLSNKELSEPELWALHGMADVFVTASRGEAWNLPAFEAMLARRQVIAPEMQGSDDFLLDTDATLYGSTTTPAQVDVRIAPSSSTPGVLNLQVVGAQGLTARCQWQEPNLPSLQLEMRKAFKHDARDLAVHYDVAAEFGRKAVGQRALDFLKEIKPT